MGLRVDFKSYKIIRKFADQTFNNCPFMYSHKLWGAKSLKPYICPNNRYDQRNLLPGGCSAGNLSLRKSRF